MTIGFDRLINIEWLDAVAQKVAAGTKRTDVRIFAFGLMDGVVAGGEKHGTAAQKTVTVLTRTWSTVNPEVVGLRDRAIALLPSLSPTDRIALHWALAIAGYKFFGDVAMSAGRLLQLQGDLNLAYLTRRLREVWGDRSTMNRATQRVIRSMVQWGALADTNTKGVYARISKPIALDDDLAALLLEGLLIHQGKAIPVDQATRHPALFPFDVSLRVHSLRGSPHFEVHRQGLDVDVVRLVSPQVG